MPKSKTVRSYTREFKEEAVKLALKSPSVSSTARELGIPLPTLHSWMNKFKKSGGEPTEKNQNDIASLLEENRRLHKAQAIAMEEKEILKKAATYFAQHQK